MRSFRGDRLREQRMPRRWDFLTELRWALLGGAAAWIVAAALFLAAMQVL
jgi:hypothetical protein